MTFNSALKKSRKLFHLSESDHKSETTMFDGSFLSSFNASLGESNSKVTRLRYWVWVIQKLHYWLQCWSCNCNRLHLYSNLPNPAYDRHKAYTYCTVCLYNPVKRKSKTWYCLAIPDCAPQLMLPDLYSLRHPESRATDPGGSTLCVASLQGSTQGWGWLGWWGWRCLATVCLETPSTLPPAWRAMGWWVLTLEHNLTIG